MPTSRKKKQKIGPKAQIASLRDSLYRLTMKLASESFPSCCSELFCPLGLQSLEESMNQQRSSNDERLKVRANVAMVVKFSRTMWVPGSFVLIVETGCLLKPGNCDECRFWCHFYSEHSLCHANFGASTRIKSSSLIPVSPFSYHRSNCTVVGVPHVKHLSHGVLGWFSCTVGWWEPDLSQFAL